MVYGKVVLFITTLLLMVILYFGVTAAALAEVGTTAKMPAIIITASNTLNDLFKIFVIKIPP